MIKFGTSGWRGIIADDFTYDNVALACQAIAEYVKAGETENTDKDHGVVVGYDTRFMSEHFARTAVEVLAGNGIKSFLCDRDTPTPVISFEILRRKADGGINFTASHNPYTYNGLKFSPSWGGPALPETTRAIEKYCRELKQEQIKRVPFEQAKKSRLVEVIDPKKMYFNRIQKLVDFDRIKKAKLSVITDVLHGTGAGYLDEMLKLAGVKQVVLRTNRDVTFDNGAPEPSKDNLGSLLAALKKNKARLGLATDGDADRFGIVDSDGTFISPNQVISVLLYHLLTNKKWKGVVARSIMTTNLIDKIAAAYDCEVRETPVGFKYIGEIMAREGNNFLIGGEESGGLTVRGHVPEKDGILACLLIAEMVATNKKTIKQTLAEIQKKVGAIYSDRVNFRLTDKQMDDFKRRLEREKPMAFGDWKVKLVVTLDGYKFILNDSSWLGFRLSGTEPVVRLYVESDSLVKVKKLAQEGARFING